MRWVIIAAILILIGSPLFFLSQTKLTERVFGQVEEKVLHAQISFVWLSPEGAAPELGTHELWFDPNTNDTKYIVKDAGGSAKIISARQGRAAKRYIPEVNSLTTDVAATGDAELLNVASSLLGYKSALKRGELERLGEGEVRGHKAIQVRRQWLSEPVTVTTWLDKETLLPLEETLSNTNPDGTQKVFGTIVWTYTVIENVPRDQIPADVFTIVVPPDATQVTNRYMSATEAATFGGFDVYYLGDSFNGLPIFAMVHRQASGPRYPQQLVSFDVGYADPFTNSQRRPDKLSVVHQPAQLHRPRETAPGQLAVGEAVQVNGVQATLYDIGAGADLELQLGSTFVTIHGANRQQVLRAGESLRKLN